MECIQTLADKYNAAIAAAVVLLTAVFGQCWFLFAGFLLLNLLDWVTGTYRARCLKTESSEAGVAGVKKKLMLWVMVTVGFVLPAMLKGFGPLIGADFSVLELIGWFILASLSINEVRSIAENLVEAGIAVPDILVRGLAVSEKLLQSKGGALLPQQEEKDENQ